MHGAGFDRFLDSSSRDAVLLGIAVSILAAFRLLLLFVQRDGIAAASSASDVAATLLFGLRYDAKIAACVAGPSFLASLACLRFDAAGTVSYTHLTLPTNREV